MINGGGKKQLRLALTPSGIHLEPPREEVWREQYFLISMPTRQAYRMLHTVWVVQKLAGVHYGHLQPCSIFLILLLQTEQKPYIPRLPDACTPGKPCKLPMQWQ